MLYTITMQSIFPYLLSWSQIAPFILRIIGGLYFAYFGYKGLTTEWQIKIDLFKEIGIRPYKLFAYTLCIVELLGGIMLLMGLMTQLAALVLFVIGTIGFIVKRGGKIELQRPADTYLLLAGMMLCLVILGAGYYGVDLPI